MNDRRWRRFEGESSYRFDVGSGTGAYGIGQIVGGTWRGLEARLGPMDRHDPVDQIRGACAYFEEMTQAALRVKQQAGGALNDYSEFELALALYNTGPGILSLGSDYFYGTTVANNPGIASLAPRRLGDNLEQDRINYLKLAVAYYSKHL